MTPQCLLECFPCSINVFKILPEFIKRNLQKLVCVIMQKDMIVQTPETGLYHHWQLSKEPQFHVTQFPHVIRIKEKGEVNTNLSLPTSSPAAAKANLRLPSSAVSLQRKTKKRCVFIITQRHTQSEAVRKILECTGRELMLPRKC